MGAGTKSVRHPGDGVVPLRNTILAAPLCVPYYVPVTSYLWAGNFNQRFHFTMSLTGCFLRLSAASCPASVTSLTRIHRAGPAFLPHAFIPWTAHHHRLLKAAN